LCGVLSKLLQLPDFVLDSHQDPPHQIFGSTECLGCEIWIEKTDNAKDFDFEIVLETELGLDELSKGQTYDISAWLAWYIKKRCKIETLPSSS